MPEVSRPYPISQYYYIIFAVDMILIFVLKYHWKMVYRRERRGVESSFSPSFLTFRADLTTKTMIDLIGWKFVLVWLWKCKVMCGQWLKINSYTVCPTVMIITWALLTDFRKTLKQVHFWEYVYSDKLTFSIKFHQNAVIDLYLLPYF